MNRIVVSRLFQSFGELETAILSAKDSLHTRSNPSPDLLQRIENYEGILEKQRRLAETLCGHVNSGAWDEVERHVKLINALSQMIRDDAREISAGLRPPLSLEEREMMLS